MVTILFRPSLRAAMRGWWGALAGLLILAGAGQAREPAAPAPAPAPAAVTVEETKATYLYKFIDYVEWPETAPRPAGEPVTIGVAGDEAVFDELKRVIAGRTQAGRPLAARRIEPGDSTADLRVLFVGRDLAEAHPYWLERLKDKRLLLVTEATNGLVGALNLVVVDQRVRFEASVPLAERAGLKLSSKLLMLATRVDTKGAP